MMHRKYAAVVLTFCAVSVWWCLAVRDRYYVLIPGQRTSDPDLVVYQAICNEPASSHPPTAKRPATNRSFHCHGACNVTGA